MIVDPARAQQYVDDGWWDGKADAKPAGKKPPKQPVVNDEGQ